MKRALVILFMAVLCCVLLISYDKKNNIAGQMEPIQKEQQIKNGVAVTTPNIRKETVKEEPQSKSQAPEGYLIKVYYGNENADGFYTDEVRIKELRADFLIEKLIEANVLPKDVKAVRFTKEGRTLKLDLNEAFINCIFSKGTAGEYLLIGSIVNTFLKAYDASEIYLTVNNEIIETGHVIYDFALNFYD